MSLQVHILQFHTKNSIIYQISLGIKEIIGTIKELDILNNHNNIVDSQYGC